MKVDRETGALGEPELVCRGFVPEADENGVMEEARRLVVRVLEGCSREERGDEGLVKARLQTELKRFLRRRTRRRPLILPVIVEL